MGKTQIIKKKIILPGWVNLDHLSESDKAKQLYAKKPAKVTFWKGKK